jgi:hypothetical protein
MTFMLKTQPNRTVNTLSCNQRFGKKKNSREKRAYVQMGEVAEEYLLS